MPEPYNDTTPGPWFYSSGAVWADKDEKVGVAQRISQSPIPPYQRDNNMRLCASAPDLLAALTGVTRILDAMGYTTTFGPTQIARLDAARAAIRKARGEAHEPSRAKGE